MLVDTIKKIQKEVQPERDKAIEERTLQLFREIKTELIKAAKDPIYTRSSLKFKVEKHPIQCWKSVAEIFREEGFVVTFSELDYYLNISWDV